MPVDKMNNSHTFTTKMLTFVAEHCLKKVERSTSTRHSTVGCIHSKTQQLRQYNESLKQRSPFVSPRRSTE